MNFFSRARKYIARHVRRWYWQTFHTLVDRRRPRYAAMPGHDLAVLGGVIAYNQYGGYCVPISSYDRRTSQTILGGGVHEPQTIEFIRSRCGDGDIVHAGAYFGDGLPALSRACAPGAKIWAFEPGAENYRCCLITLQINDLKNVVLMRAGLGARAGYAQLIITNKWGRAMGAASRVVLEGQSLPEGELEEIQLICLDDVIPLERRVSILHLDVEKHEQHALQGALQIIQRCKPILILETLPEASWQSQHLFPLGYRAAEQQLRENQVLLPSA